MIAVIADDFTGAAELAGISLRYGLKVELCTAEIPASNADVLIVSTDSRSLNRVNALEKTGDVLKQVLKLNPAWVYKKIDSVLRGYVVDELKVQMNSMKKKQSIHFASESIIRQNHPQRNVFRAGFAHQRNRLCQ